MWTDPDDVLSRWVGPGAPDDEDLLERLIADAEQIIRTTAPGIEDRVYDPDDPPDPMPERPLSVETVRMVVARMVIRHLRNPEGFRSHTETDGPFSRTAMRGGDEPGALWLSDEDRELLGISRSGMHAFTVPQDESTGWFSSPSVWWSM